MKATMTWRQAHFGAVDSGTLQLPCTSSNGTGFEEEATHSSPWVDIVGMKFWLDDVWGLVYTMW